MDFNNTTPEQKNYSTINTPIQTMVEDSKKDSKVGPLIGSIIVILIFIIGGLYFWGSIITNRKLQLEEAALLEEARKAPTNTTQTNTTETQVESTGAATTSVDLDIQ